MSASERLRELDGAMTASYNRTLVPMDDGYFSSREITRLRAALPLIADCIEAAEKMRADFKETLNAWSWAEFDGKKYTDEETAAEFTAALTALREHLEGGDE